MSCDENRLVSFLNGHLSPDDEHAFDEHLLTCEACWEAVRADRAGRRALEQLRVAAPADLADRVSTCIRLADRLPGPSEVAIEPGRLSPRAPGALFRKVVFRRPRRLVAATAAAVLIAGVLGWVLHDRPAADPPQIAAVVAMMAPDVANKPALRAGERFDLAGQAVSVRSYRVEDQIVLVATSVSPFPMPKRSHTPSGSSGGTWMAAEGHLAMYGVNHPTGAADKSMFLVAAMPMAKLPQVAARLHLT